MKAQANMKYITNVADLDLNYLFYLVTRMFVMYAL